MESATHVPVREVGHLPNARGLAALGLAVQMGPRPAPFARERLLAVRRSTHCHAPTERGYRLLPRLAAGGLEEQHVYLPLKALTEAAIFALQPAPGLP